MRMQHLIKKIPCLDSWNHMISKAKHRYIKKINFCIPGVEKKNMKILIGKEIKIPGKISIKP